MSLLHIDHGMYHDGIFWVCVSSWYVSVLQWLKNVFKPRMQHRFFYKMCDVIVVVKVSYFCSTNRTTLWNFKTAHYSDSNKRHQILFISFRHSFRIHSFPDRAKYNLFNTLSSVKTFTAIQFVKLCTDN